MRSSLSPYGPQSFWIPFLLPQKLFTASDFQVTLTLRSISSAGILGQTFSTLHLYYLKFVPYQIILYSFAPGCDKHIIYYYIPGIVLHILISLIYPSHNYLERKIQISLTWYLKHFYKMVQHFYSCFPYSFHITIFVSWPGKLTLP